MSFCDSTRNSFCPKEIASADAKSPGKVANFETLCRGAYYPMHLKKKNGEPQTSFIKARDLHEGVLSVWRLDGAAPFKLEDIVMQLKLRGPKHKDNELASICAATAGEVRKSLQDPAKNQGRFCVIDNTECGVDENHPAHAVIALCPSLGTNHLPFDEAKAEGNFNQASRDLLALFREFIIWRT